MTKGDKLDVVKSEGGTFPAKFSGEGECRDCGDAVLWVETAKGKKMPVDFAEEEGAPHMVHWRTCSKSGMASEPKPASASSPSLADRVKRLEDAVFGKKAAATVTEGTPPANDLPFALILAATLAFTLI